MTRRLDTAALVMHSPDVRSRPVDDELVLYNPRTDDVTRLDSAGTLIWRLLAEPASSADLAAAIGAAFDVDVEVASADVMQLLQRLLDAQLVVTRPPVAEP